MIVVIATNVTRLCWHTSHYYYCYFSVM